MASLGLILASMVSWEPTMRWSVILVSACGAIIILFRIWTKLYNVYLHPLAKFPGPPEAASSTAWMYSVLKSGSPEQQYEKLHKLYQTKALRIAPNELHITDVHQYKVIYGAITPFPKLPSFYNSFHTPHTVFVEIDPTLHKKRRQMLNPLFSRTGVFKLEPIIHEKVKNLLHQIDNLTGERTINLYDAFRHLTADIIMEFGFGKPPSIPEKNELGFRLIDALEGFGQNIWTMQEWPLLNMISGMIPLPIMRHFNDGFGPMARLMKYAEVCLQEYEKGRYTKRHPIVFDHLLTLPYDLKIMEAVELLIAGSGTTASTLTSGLFHILQNKGIQARLTSAVQKVQPNEKGILPLSELEKIDYLVACAKESLRAGLAIPGRLPRVVPVDPKQPFVVDGKIVPPGTIVSLSAYTMHYSEELWGEDARSFNPDRWLGPDSKKLDQYLCTFSKGARMCLGHNLASAEVIIILAYLFKGYSMSLPQDFKLPRARDNFVSEYDSPGLPVTFGTYSQHNHADKSQ